MRQKVDTWKIPAVFGSIFGVGAITGALVAVKWCYKNIFWLELIHNARRER